VGAVSYDGWFMLRFPVMLALSLQSHSHCTDMSDISEVSPDSFPPEVDGVCSLELPLTHHQGGGGH